VEKHKEKILNTVFEFFNEIKMFVFIEPNIILKEPPPTPPPYYVDKAKIILQKDADENIYNR